MSPADLPRYTDYPLPPYRFVPGTGQPHPMSPNGYMRDYDWVFEAIRPPRRWVEQASYLFGIDLFNHGYWWEAHEAWEELWHRTRDPMQHELIHGLIQLGAAHLKVELGKPRGVRVLAGKAMQRLSAVRDSPDAASGRYMGLDLAELVGQIDTAFAPYREATRQSLVVPVAPIVLWLSIPNP